MRRWIQAVPAFSVALAASIVCSPTFAAPPPSNGDPATSVYVEQIPTSSGSVPASGAMSHSAALGRAATNTIDTQAGKDARALKRIAKTVAPSASAAQGTAPAQESGNTGRLIALLAVVGLIVLGLAAIARRGRRGGGSAAAGP
jgi:hypothetical protein